MERMQTQESREEFQAILDAPLNSSRRDPDEVAPEVIEQEMSMFNELVRQTGAGGDF